MLYEYALTPHVFSVSCHPKTRNAQAMEIILEQVLRDVLESGLIANLNKNRWYTEVLGKHLDMLAQGGHRDRVQTLLKQLGDDHRLVRHRKAQNGYLNDEADWLSLAHQSHHEIPFDAIVTTGLGVDRVRCFALDEVLNSPPWNLRRRTRSMTQSRNHYSKALTVPLRHAKVLHLVDPHFKPETRFITTIELCVEAMGKRVGDSSQGGLIYIHTTSSEILDAAFFKMWENTLREKLKMKASHALYLCVWGMRPGRPMMHDRYILTDQCGIQAPAGLDCPDTPSAKSTDWFLLDRDTWKARMEEFPVGIQVRDPNTPYELLAHHELSVWK